MPNAKKCQSQTLRNATFQWSSSSLASISTERTVTTITAKLKLSSSYYHHSTKKKKETVLPTIILCLCQKKCNEVYVVFSDKYNLRPSTCVHLTTTHTETHPHGPMDSNKVYTSHAPSRPCSCLIEKLKNSCRKR